MPRSLRASQAALVVKNPLVNTGDMRQRFSPWVRKIPWRREWLPTPVFLPGEFHGQRSLLGYSPWGHKELDMTERLTLSFFIHTIDTGLEVLCTVPCTDTIPIPFFFFKEG